MKMKKMFFGGLLLSLGFIGLLVFTITSTFNPHDYNGVTGLRGFLLGTETIFSFIVFLTMGAFGIIICTYETYIKK